MAFGSIQNQNSAYGLKNEVDQILTNTNNIITTTGNIYTNTNQIQTTSNSILSKVNAIQTDIQQQQGNYNLNPTNVYKTIVSETVSVTTTGDSFNENKLIYVSDEILKPGIYKLAGVVRKATSGMNYTVYLGIPTSETSGNDEGNLVVLEYGDIPAVGSSFASNVGGVPGFPTSAIALRVLTDSETSISSTFQILFPTHFGISLSIYSQQQAAGLTAYCDSLILYN